MKPARSMSWWLTTSASAGASLSVETKNWLAFIGVALALDALARRREDGERRSARRARV